MDTHGASHCSSTPSVSSAVNVEMEAPLPPIGESNLDRNQSGSWVASENDSQNPVAPEGVGQKRKEPSNKSPLWLHFTRCTHPVTNVIDPCWCTCNYCKERVHCDSKKNGTSSMWAHTRRCGSCPLYEAPDPKQAKLNRDNVTGAPQYHSFSQKRIDEKCVEYIIKDELPLRADPPNFYKDPTEDELEMYTALEELEKENAATQSLERPQTNSTANTSVQTSAATTN